MTQDILTTLAISGAGGYCIYSFFKIIINVKQKKTSCGGCSGCSPKQHNLNLNKKS